MDLVREKGYLTNIEIINLATKNDGMYKGYFAVILEAKKQIKRRRHPAKGYHHVLDCISQLENRADYLKYYQGYITTKKVIMTGYKKFQERQYQKQ